jgi:hypothetical protein
MRMTLFGNAALFGRRRNHKVWRTNAVSANGLALKGVL